MRDVARLMQRFARSESYVHLARHAAFPVALTPDLLYRLWFNFQRDINGNYLNIPWVAVPDFLLSHLVTEVGYELYEMLPDVRSQLLDELKALPQFGPVRILELAEFTRNFAERHLSQETNRSSGFASIQIMNSLAYSDPQSALSKLALAYKNMSAGSKAELLRLASVVENLSGPMRDNVKEDQANNLRTELDKLQNYAKGLTIWVQQDVAGAADHLQKYFGDSAQVEIAGVSIRLPELITPQSPTSYQPDQSSYIPQPQQDYHILCFDGAGVRVSLTAGVLARLRSINSLDSAGVTLLCGASNGAILALALAKGLTAAEAVQLIRRSHEDVYRNILLDHSDVGRITGAESDNRRLKSILLEAFGDSVLGDLEHTVLIPTVQLDNDRGFPAERKWRTKFFHNLPGDDSDVHEKVVDIAMRACASPVFFPTYQGYIDASLAVSNPAMCAVAQVLAAGVDLSRIRLLSIGGGVNPSYLEGTDENWGLAQWGPHLMDILLEADRGAVDFQCRQLLGNRYLRIDPLLPKVIGWGDVQSYPFLMERASSVDLSLVEPWLRKNFIKSNREFNTAA